MTEEEYERALRAVLSERLLAARRRAKMTQVRVAFLLGTSENVYGRYERGQLMPSAPRLCALASVLDCSVDYLLGLDTVAPPAEGFQDPLPLRRLLRRIRRASFKELRLVYVVLKRLGLDDDDSRAS